MRHYLRLSLFLLPAIMTLASCTTPVVLVDNHWGFEHVRSQRSAHLESTRVVIDDCGDGVHRFELRLKLSNFRNQTWTVRRGDWTVELRDAADQRCPGDYDVAIAGDGDPLVTIPPAAETPLSVTFELTVPPDSKLTELERFRVHVALQSDREALLQKRFSIGEFDQVGQAVRMFGVVTAALLALSFL